MRAKLLFLGVLIVFVASGWAQAPSIITPPQSQSVVAGSNVTFTVQASGAATLKYQWRLNGANIASATNSSYAINPVRATNAGSFVAVVTNSLGAVTSAVATLTVTGVATPSGLVGWWQAESNAIDYVNTNSGMLNFGVTYTNGMVGSTFRFDGTNGYVSIPDSSWLKPTNLTLEAWVRFDSLNSGGEIGGSPAGQQYIIFKQNSRENLFEGYYLGKERSGSVDHFVFDVTSAGGTIAEVVSTTSVTSNVWYHVAAVRGSNFIHLYVNGVREDQDTVSDPQDYGNKPLFFGSSGTDYWDHKFKGMLDEVSLYNRALSSNEIAGIFYSGAIGKLPMPLAISLVEPISDSSILVPDQPTLVASIYGPQRFATKVQFYANGSLLGETTNCSSGFGSLTWTNPPTGTNALAAVLTDYAGLRTTSSIVNVTVTERAFVKGINLTGSTAAIEGNSWLSHQSATNNGLTVSTNATALTRTNFLSMPKLDTNNPSMLETFVARLRVPPTNVVPRFIYTNPTTYDRYVTLSNVPPGYVVSNIQYRAWCVQNNTVNQPGTYYCNLFYSYGAPDPRFSGRNFNKINYILNNKGSASSQDIQQAIWWTMGDLTSTSNDNDYKQLTNNAALYGADYVPQYPTNVAGVIVEALTNANMLQPVIAEVGCSNLPVSFTVTQTLTNATYSLYLWMAEYDESRVRHLDVKIQGSTGATNLGDQELGRWHKYGPYTASVTTGAVTLEISSPMRGDPALMGISFYTTNSAANQPPTVTVTNPANNSVFAAGVAIPAAATASDPDGSITSVQFLNNGAPIGTASAGSGNSYTLTWTNAPTGTNTLQAVATDNGGLSVTSAPIGVIVYPLMSVSVVPPTTNLCSGQPGAFTASVSGVGPYTYLWKKNGSVLSGGTNSSFAIASAAPGDAGTYTVEVTGLYDAGTNSGALTVLTNTSAVGPFSQTVCPGTTAGFSASVGGSGLSFVWKKNGAVIVGQNGTSLTLSNVTSADAGSYCLEVTGNCGNVTNCATLTVLTNTSVSGLTNLAICPGSTALFSPTVAGSGLIFTWWKDNVLLTNQSAQTLTLTNVSLADVGTYCVVAAGDCGAATNCASLAVITNTSASGPTNLIASVGGPATLTVTALGNNLGYTWRKDGSLLTGQSASSLVLSNLTAGDAGSYCVIVTGDCGSVTNCATLAVNLAPVVDAGTNQLGELGQSLTLYGAASDDGLPTGQLLTSWGLVSGPGDFIFGDPHSSNTTVVVSAVGSYVFRLTATDTVLTNSDDVTVTFLPANEPPNVSVESRQLVIFPAGLHLDGFVSDDGYPTGSVVTVLWTKISGAGTVTITNATSTNATAGFSATGDYVVRLTATDSVLTNYADLRVAVRNPQDNEAPVVSAGGAKVVGLTNQVQLDGYITDDGLPLGTNIVATWGKVSGPGTVTFGDAGVTNTTATFSAVGTYVLQLIGSDTLLSATNEVTVTVYPFNQPPSVDAGTNQTVTIADPSLLYQGRGQPLSTNLELQRSLSAVPHWNHTVGQPGLPGEVYFKGLSAADGVLYAGGGFGTTTNLVNNKDCIRRWDGASWSTMYGDSPSYPGGPNYGFLSIYQDVTDLVLGARGDELLVQSRFIRDLGDDVGADNTARWDGAGWREWQVQTTGGVGSVGEWAFGSNLVYMITSRPFYPTNWVSSGVTYTNLPICQGVATWDGTNWGTLGSNGISGAVRCGVLSPDQQNLYVGGNFTFATPSGYATNIAVWNGSQWSPLGRGIWGSGATVYSLAVDERGFLYAVGFIQHAGDADLVSNPHIAKWDGTNWSGVGGGLGSAVDLLLVAARGRDVYAAGNFLSAGGKSVNRIAKWNGYSWNALSGGMTNGVNSNVTSLAVAPEGVYVAGKFTQAGGSNVNYISLWEYPQPPLQGALLSGRVEDDGLPSGQLNLHWEKASGPGTATFANPTSAVTTVTFDQLGTYVLRLSANDSALTNQDEVTITVQGNQPPTVSAGTNQSVNAGGPVFLAGSVSDDGYPLGEEVSSLWTVLNGPGIVTFANATLAQTAATFSSTGTYVLRLSANDTYFTAFADVTIQILTSNAPPVVRAYFTNAAPVWPASANVVGFASDDGRPNGTLLRNWTQVDGPGPVVFANTRGTNAQVFFPEPGTYEVKLTATDSQLTTSSTNVLIQVLPPGAPTNPPSIYQSNQAPVVVAGNSTSTALLLPFTLQGCAVDDGLPTTNTMVTMWCQVSGPAAARFGNTAKTNTTVSFYLTGTYVLRLSADDGKMSSYADVSITVTAGTNLAPLVWADGDVIVTRPDAAELYGVVLDDDLPLGYPLQFQWSKISGPGTVTFLTSGGTNTNTSAWQDVDEFDALAFATFSTNGTYVLELRGTDTEYTNTDQITITVLPGVNSAPIVNAGPDFVASLPNVAILHTEVVDDGLESGAVQVSWSKVSGPGAVYFSSVNGVYRAAFGATGTYVLRLTGYDGALSATDDVTVTVYETLPPVAQITSPADGDVITAPSNVIGTASSAILQSYVLEYRSQPIEDIESVTPWIVFASNTVSVTSNALASFDPTLLFNGLYQMRLTATDISGRATTTEPVSFRVDRNLKVGQFTMSFSDLSVPLAGIPIEIVRTYDSREKRTNDFGIGWSIDIRNVRLQKSRNLGANWHSLSLGGGHYSLDAVKPRQITVTFGNDKSYQFQSVLNPADQWGAPIEAVSMTFTNLPGTYGKLEIDGDNEAWVYGFTDFVDLIDFDDFDYFNPTRFKFTTAEGDIYILDEKEGIKSHTDRDGNTLTISTNGIFHSSGVNIAFTRDAQGRITAITDPMGKSLYYTYGTNGSLATFTDRVTNITTFAYTNVTYPNYLTQITDPRGVKALRVEFDTDGRMIRQTDANGNTIFFDHDIANRRETIQDRLGNATVHEYDERGNVLRTTDPLNHVTTYKFDDNDNQLEKVETGIATNRFTYDVSGNKLTEVDGLGYTNRYTYGKFRELTSQKNARGFSTTNRFDANTSNLLEERDALQHVTSYSYDGAGNLVTRTDALGNVTSNRYDGFGRVTNTVVIDALRGMLNSTAYTYDTNGNQLTKSIRRTIPSGSELLVTQYAYDAENRLIQTIYPDGGTNRTIYALGLDKPAVEIDALGRQTLHYYDARGNLTNTVHADGTTEFWNYDAENRMVAMTDKASRVMTYNHDPLGRVTNTVFVGGSTSNTVFDAIGRIIATVDERNNTNRYVYELNCGCGSRQADVIDALGRLTHYDYDRNANQTTMVDASNRVTSFIYDELDRRTYTVFPDGTWTATTYDAVGRRIAETDQSTNTTWFGYDALSRLVAVTNALGKATLYSYDEAGSLIAQTDANNHTTTFEYDRMGRRVKRTLPGTQVETYAYDLAGNLTNKVDFNNRSTQYRYDALNRLTNKTPDAYFSAPAVGFSYTVTGQRATMSDASGVTTYLYNGRDWLTNKSWLPTGQASPLVLKYGHDVHGNVTRIYSGNASGVDTTYSYDALNRVATVTDVHVGNTSYSYDLVGNLASFQYPNNVTNGYTYDALNRLTNQASGYAGSARANYQYTVGPAGHRRTAVEQVAAPGGVQTVNRLFSYDATYRLTNETLTATGTSLPASAAVGYALDDVGNRLGRSSSLPGVGATTTTYDANDRLHSDTYDANGNTTAGHLIAGDAGVSDSYDFEDRLINRNSGAVVIKYDGDGQRVAKTVSGVTTYFLVDDRNPTGYAQVMEELPVVAGTPVVAHVYAYGLDLIAQDQLVADGMGGWVWSASYYGYDGHGNVRYLTDVSGAVTDTYDYDAFGTLVDQTGTTPNLYLYCGEQYDADLGLYYNRARYLNTDSGRFWSRDVFEGETQEPASLHKYLYAGGDAINNVDASGYYFLVEIVAGVNLRTGEKRYDAKNLRVFHKLSKKIICGGGKALLTASRVFSGGHHLLPKFGGGAESQNLLDNGFALNQVLHRIIQVMVKNEETLKHLDALNGSKAQWQQALKNPAARKAAIRVLVGSARVIDKYCGFKYPNTVAEHVKNTLRDESNYAPNFW